jgi:hypothetical protein
MQSRSLLLAEVTSSRHVRHTLYAEMSTVPLHFLKIGTLKLKTKLHGWSPRANYTDRATAACRRSDCQLVRIEGATWSA